MSSLADTSASLADFGFPTGAVTVETTGNAFCLQHTVDTTWIVDATTVTAPISWLLCRNATGLARLCQWAKSTLTATGAFHCWRRTHVHGLLRRLPIPLPSRAADAPGDAALDDGGREAGDHHRSPLRRGLRRPDADMCIVG